MTNSSNDDSMSVPTTTELITNTVTAQQKIAIQESKEHMTGMKSVYDEFRNRSILIRAHLLFSNDDTTKVDDPTMKSIAATTTTTTTTSNADSSSNNNNSTYKTIHFIRHGQGFHNLLADIATESGITWRQFESNHNSASTKTTTSNTSTTPTNDNPYLRLEVMDAPLTELGRKQAQQLHNDIMVQKSLLLLSNIDRVYVSPHCRTLQTGLIAFQHLISPPILETVVVGSTKNLLIAHELLREESGIHICDQRRNISWQCIEFPQYDFHTHCVSDIDPLVHKQKRETKLQVAQRIYHFMEFISNLSDDVNNIAVVSHSGWLHILFNAIVQDDCHPSLKQWFQTGEMRSVRIEFISRG